jgi:aminoglycoside phosphotransferase (APT) family kinase protein
MSDQRPPAAAGVRPGWGEVPGRVRAAIEACLEDRVVAAESAPGGFSPGLAARLRTRDGRRVFVKAVGPEPNPDSAAMHRREVEVVGALPPEAPVPRLLWSYDEGEEGWVVLAFEDVDGRSPAEPWRSEELDRSLDALAALAGLLTPSPLPQTTVGSPSDWPIVAGGHWRKLQQDRPARLDGWSARHLDRLAELEAEAPAAAGGDTLLHLDLRADNLLLTRDRVVVVDWPHARVGAPWVDLLFFAPSVAMQGGPPPEELLSRYPPARHADPAAITAVVCAIAGFFVGEGLQPAPPGLPTLRPFQAAQGEVAQSWLALRTGWR